MRVVVTRGEGFLGSHVCDVLVELVEGLERTIPWLAGELAASGR